MRKNVFISLILFMLVFSFGTAQAATSQIDNMPGGAGVIYFQGGSDWQTLVNWQSLILAVNMTIHVAVFDKDSVEKCDFQFPLTPRDNVGMTITGNGTSEITIFPYSDDAFGGSGIPATGLVCQIGAGTGANAGLNYGYITYVIDKLSPVGVDPTATPTFSRLPFVNPDWVYARAALLKGTDNAIGMNGPSFQGFANLMDTFFATGAGLNESINGGGQFINTNGVNAICNVAAGSLDWNGGSGSQFASIDDGNGPNIDSWEQYLTDNGGPFLLADGAVTGAAACSRAGRKAALGSANGRYWARFNQDGGIESTLVLVFPASQGQAAGTADPRGTSSVSLLSYNDAEAAISTTLTPIEVERTKYTIIPHTTEAGETLITTSTPMFGWVFTDSAGFADAYPIIRESAWVNVINLNGVDQLAPAVTDAIRLGL